MPQENSGRSVQKCKSQRKSQQARDEESPPSQERRDAKENFPIFLKHSRTEMRKKPILPETENYYSWHIPDRFSHSLKNQTHVTGSKHKRII
jgi:hypothetical protein